MLYKRFRYIILRNIFFGYMNKLIVKEKNYYGKKFYPSCDKSKMLAKFAGVKCFSAKMVMYLIGLGYEIVCDRPQTSIRPPKIIICPSCGRKDLAYPQSEPSLPCEENQ